MEQIAGNELWPASPEARVATGFARHYESNARYCSSAARKFWTMLPMPPAQSSWA